jgi:SAM-dependent methyltransferase
MSDTRDGNEPEDTSDESESLVPPRSGRKRRGLRVPVDDVPRQSFVDVKRPDLSARSSSVGVERPSTPEPTPDPSRGQPEASRVSTEASRVSTEASVDTSPRARVASVELSLDAELEVEPTPPPPPPRSYRPPPPPPPAPKAAPAADTSLDELAHAVGVDASDELSDGAGDELASEPTRVTAPLAELDFQGAQPEPERTPLVQETTKVGKKRSSAPPPEATPASLPDDPLEAPRRNAPSEAPPPPTLEPVVVRESVAPRPSRPPLSVESRATPRGLFGGAGSTEAPVPDEDFHDTVLAEVEDVPRARRITTALPRRGSERTSADPDAEGRSSAAPSEPPEEAAQAEAATREDTATAETEAITARAEDAWEREASDAPDASAAPSAAADSSATRDPSATPDASATRAASAAADAHDADPDSVRRTLVETEDDEAVVTTTEAPADEVEISVSESAPDEVAPSPLPAAPPSVETLVGLGAPTPSSPGVMIAPTVVVQRAVAVVGTPSQPPPEPRATLTTPGGLSAPAAKTEDPKAEEREPLQLDRESDPGLPLDLDADPASLADEAVDLVEVPSQPAPPKPAPPPPVAAKPPPPKPPAPPPAAAPAPQIATEERAQLPSRPPPKKKHQWWEELFSDDDLRTVPIPTNKAIAKQVDFIEARLGLAKGATILDVGCGLGLHAIELTRRGYLVVGLDLSLPMLSRAADEAQDHGFKINFLHADMREMNFEGAFDAVLLWGTTLGYFDDETNKGVLERIHRALKPGGLLLLEVVNRDFAVKSQPNLVWFQGDGCVVMEETAFNFIASRLSVKRNVILDDGRQRETTYSIRLYSLHELGQVLHLRGFRVVEITGREATPGVYFGADSPKLIILAERRIQAPPAPPKKSETADTKTDTPRVEVTSKLQAPQEKDPSSGES